MLLEDLNIHLCRKIETSLEQAADPEALFQTLDQLLIPYILNFQMNPAVCTAVQLVIRTGGSITGRELARITCYSEKQLNRLYQKYIGTGIKTFSRIVRLNHAIRQMENQKPGPVWRSLYAGYYDESHFNRDFKDLCGITPGEYLKNRSIFYNDSFKL